MRSLDWAPFLCHTGYRQNIIMCISCLSGGFHDESLSDNWDDILSENCDIGKEEVTVTSVASRPAIAAPLDATDPINLYNPAWIRFAKNQYLEDGVVEVVFDKKMAGQVKKLVKRTLNEIEDITGLDIVKKKGIRQHADADTDIIIDGIGKRKWQRTIAPSSLGTAYVDDKTYISYATWDNGVVQETKRIYSKKGVFKRKKKVIANDRARQVVVHEILHTFGVGHPQGTGRSPHYNSDDTVMSYNFTGTFRGMSELDKRTLSSIWAEV